MARSDTLAREPRFVLYVQKNYGYRLSLCLAAGSSLDGLEEGGVGGLLLVVAVPEESVTLAGEDAGDPRVLVADALLREIIMLATASLTKGEARENTVQRTQTVMPTQRATFMQLLATRL